MKNYGYTKDNFIKTHFSVDIAREVAKRTHEVSLHVFWDKKDIYHEKNLTIYFYPLSLTKIFNSGFAEISLDVLNLAFSDDTIIHFHEPTRLFFPIFMVGKKNKIFVEHHGTGINNPFPYPSRFSIPFEIFRKFFLSKFLQKANGIIVHNKLAQENIRTYGINDKKIVLVPNGIQPDKYTLLPKSQARKKLALSKKLLILFVGRVHVAKGIKELVTAYEKLKQKRKNIELAILGPLDDITLKDIVKPYWKGFKNPEELQMWLSAADIFCLPSYSEPFGIVLVEALFYNLPIITTNIAGPKEFVPSKNALFIPPKDPFALQQALEKMLDKKLRNKKSKGGNKLVRKKYTWNHICSIYIKRYKE